MFFSFTVITVQLQNKQNSILRQNIEKTILNCGFSIIIVVKDWKVT